MIATSHVAPCEVFYPLLAHGYLEHYALKVLHWSKEIRDFLVFIEFFEQVRTGSLFVLRSCIIFLSAVF